MHGAPLFEEPQSRAFILRLTALLPLRNALLVQGLLFGAQHLQLGLPLSVTGFIWGVLYVNSGNLLVPVLICTLECAHLPRFLLGVVGQGAEHPRHSIRRVMNRQGVRAGAQHVFRWRRRCSRRSPHSCV